MRGENLYTMAMAAKIYFTFYPVYMTSCSIVAKQ